MQQIVITKEQRFSDTGELICASQISAEANALKIFAEMTHYYFDSINMDKNEQAKLYSAIEGLNIIINVHAKHAEELALTTN